jgi:hypothetical protein
MEQFRPGRRVGERGRPRLGARRRFGTHRASSGGQTDSIRVHVRPPPCAAASAGSLGLGETRTGSLGPNDCLLWGWLPAVGWSFHLSTTSRVQIDLRSTAFDPLIVLTNLDLQLLHWDDDSGTGRNARLTRELPAGEYIIWATSFDSNPVGAYQLEVSEYEIVPCNNVVGNIEVGQFVSGSLSQADCSRDGRFVDPWSLTLTSAATLRIDLTSSEFDTFLIVEDADGIVVDWDDDGGEGFNSQITMTFAAGEYHVLVTSYWMGETGTYQLRAQDVGGGGSPNLLSRAGAAAPQLPREKPVKD